MGRAFQDCPGYKRLKIVCLWPLLRIRAKSNDDDSQNSLIFINPKLCLDADPDHPLQHGLHSAQAPRGQDQCQRVQPTPTHCSHDETYQGRSDGQHQPQPVRSSPGSNASSASDGLDRSTSTSVYMGNGQSLRSRPGSPGSGKATSPRPNGEPLATFEYKTQSSEDAFLDDILRGIAKAEGPDDGSCGQYFFDDSDNFFGFLSGDKAEAPDFGLSASWRGLRATPAELTENFPSQFR